MSHHHQPDAAAIPFRHTRAMADELLYTVAGITATPARPVTLASQGLHERSHLQEWVLGHPEILGGDVKVITFEFAKWVTGKGEAAADRLDILALDRSGRLVLAELKRDRAPDTVTMQAINYAAMVSRFSLDTLSEVYAAHLNDGLGPDHAREVLEQWATDLSDETLSPPRIVLLANEFGPTVTNTALFLFEAGLDIRLRRYQLYVTKGDERVLSVTQLLPVPDADEFMVKPRSSTATQAEVRERRERRMSVPARLVAANALAEGEQLTIVVPKNVHEDKATVSAWLAAKPDRGAATWTGDPQAPVMWAYDGQRYSLSNLVRRIILIATEQPSLTNVWGPSWFRNSAGTSLHHLADH